MDNRKRVGVDEATALPSEVLAAIEGATFHPRPDGDDGAPRTVVQLCHLRGWIHGADDAKYLANAFPELTDAQIARACRYLATVVRRHINLMQTGGNSPRKNWVHEW